MKTPIKGLALAVFGASCSTGSYALSLPHQMPGMPGAPDALASVVATQAPEAQLAPPQDATEQERVRRGHGGHVGEHVEHDWHESPHHLSVMPAGTFEEEESAFSIGVDYEYRITDFLGVGGVVEYAFNDIDATTIFAAADLHLTRRIIMQVGPGVEFVDGETEPMFRVGMLYELELDGYTLSPQLHYDWNSGQDSLVFGVAFGWAF